MLSKPEKQYSLISELFYRLSLSPNMIMPLSNALFCWVFHSKLDLSGVYLQLASRFIITDR